MDNDRAERSRYNAQRKLEAVRDREIDDSLGAIMQHPNGRRLIYWLLSLGRLGRNPFSTHALSTAFACGELNVAQQLQARILVVVPQLFTTMLTEMENERISDTSRTSGGTSSAGDSADGAADD